MFRANDISNQQLSDLQHKVSDTNAARTQYGVTTCIIQVVYHQQVNKTYQLILVLPGCLDASV